MRTARSREWFWLAWNSKYAIASSYHGVLWQHDSVYLIVGKWVVPLGIPFGLRKQRAPICVAGAGPVTSPLPLGTLAWLFGPPSVPRSYFMPPSGERKACTFPMGRAAAPQGCPEPLEGKKNEVGSTASTK